MSSIHDISSFRPPVNTFTAQIAGALYEKYSTSVNFYHINLIEKHVKDQISSDTVKLRQALMQADDTQFMRRQYAQEEFQGKITHLSEYYKYSRDLPLFYQPNILKVMDRYHQKVRQHNFKIVKAVLKRQQGISLTSQHNQSSFPRSDMQIRDNYSSVLHDIGNQSNSQSCLIHKLCDRLNDALGSDSFNTTFKGNFNEPIKNFQNFISKQQKIKNVNQFTKKSNPPSFQECSRNDKENTLKSGLNIMKSKSKLKKRQIQKTTANQTISREEKNKKQKQGPSQINHRYSHSNHNQYFKPVTQKSQLNNMRKIDQAYKCSTQQYSEKYHSIKDKRAVNKKNKITKPDNKSKGLSHTRKESTQNLFIMDTQRLFRDQSKKSIRRPSALKKTMTRQQNKESIKILPQPIKSRSKSRNPKDEETRRKSLSKSKSRSRLSKQNSRQDIHSKNFNLRSLSNARDRPVMSLESSGQVDKLLSKKLALFIKC